MTLATDIALAIRLADAAGAAIRPFYRSAFSHEAKDDTSPVTDADRAAEAAMRRILDAEAPRDGIIGEEYGREREGASRQWVLDPIDGTVSFMAGRPIFGTLIALMEGGFPVLGIIDQPIAGERWIGATGVATTLNGREVRTRPCRELSDAVLASTGPQYFDDHAAEHFMALAAKTAHKRLVWGGDCYNYGLLAAGHLDLVVEAGLKLHDLAALAPIVEGAGGLMCDWDGEPLHEGSAGHVIALGDPARLEDVLEGLACGH
jgi:inositol-phosphate phosphatase / L-galactose 1-phosphate phosphatase / histidinol-phosphatase